jgi:hypothetical protein
MFVVRQLLIILMFCCIVYGSSRIENQMLSKEYKYNSVTRSTQIYTGNELQYRKYPLKCCDTNVGIDLANREQVLNFFIQCTQIQGKIKIKQKGFDFFKDAETNKYYVNVSKDAFNPIQENCYLLLLVYKK